MEMEDKRITILHLNIKLMLLKAIENPMEDPLEQCEEQKHVKTKEGGRTYLEMIDSKYAGMIYKVKARLALFAVLEVLKLKVLIEKCGSYSEGRIAEKSEKEGVW